jgi:hypothetical protein
VLAAAVVSGCVRAVRRRRGAWPTVRSARTAHAAVHRNTGQRPHRPACGRFAPRTRGMPQHPVRWRAVALR